MLTSPKADSELQHALQARIREETVQAGEPARGGRHPAHIPCPLVCLSPAPSTGHSVRLRSAAALSPAPVSAPLGFTARPAAEGGGSCALDPAAGPVLFPAEAHSGTHAISNSFPGGEVQFAPGPPLAPSSQVPLKGVYRPLCMFGHTLTCHWGCIGTTAATFSCAAVPCFSLFSGLAGVGN